MRSRDIRDAALISTDMNLLNSPPRGTLVDGLPRAASIIVDICAPDMTVEWVFHLNSNSGAGSRVG